MLVGRSQMLERPLGAIEAIKGPEEAFGRIGGGRAPRRAHRRQQLGEFGQQPSHDGLSRAALALGLELCQALAHGALRGRVR
ncbi:hypothetical protein NKDENANG_00475 [Candidatus Entotheonellaceae bacterium PAL068K]